jgi:hypothetical protein
MNRSIFDSPIAKVAIVLIFLVAFAVWLMWPQHIPPPDEANRVWHPDGYSVIRPAGWQGGAEPHMEDATMLGRINMRPQNPGLRSPSFSIINWRKQPDLKELKAKEHFTDSTFLGHPALMFEGQWRGNWAERIIWQDQDRWFDLNLNIPIEEDLQHSAWWPYVESFRYDPKMAKQAATAPTTINFAPVFPTTQNSSP